MTPIDGCTENPGAEPYLAAFHLTCLTPHLRAKIRYTVTITRADIGDR
jgi:hypothetical protein